MDNAEPTCRGLGGQTGVMQSPNQEEPQDGFDRINKKTGPTSAIHMWCDDEGPE